MESKMLMTNVITAVVTALVLGLGGWMFGVFEAGSAAINDAQIEAVIKRVLVLDNGDSYATTLDSIDKSVGEINVSIGHIQGDIQRIDGAVAALAAE